MVNKKGYIKTLEAVIAIILIVTVSYTLIPKNVITSSELPLSLQGAMKFINEKIELDENIRQGIIYNEPIESKIAAIIEENIPRNYDFTCAICSSSSRCFPKEYPLEKSIYVSDVFIASSGQKQSPKIVRVWFWESPTESMLFLNECRYPTQ